MKTVTLWTCLAMLCCCAPFGVMSSTVLSPPDPCAREDANGCTTLPFTSFPYQKEFTPSCNRHDMCYGCAVAYGVTRRNCDDALLRNMVQTCRPYSDPSTQTSKRGLLSSFAKNIRKTILINLCRKVSKLMRDQDEPELVCGDNNMKFLSCIEVAHNAHGLVRNVGGFFFSTKPEGYCDKDFLPACLPDKYMNTNDTDDSGN